MKSSELVCGREQVCGQPVAASSRGEQSRSRRAEQHTRTRAEQAHRSDAPITSDQADQGLCRPDRAKQVCGERGQRRAHAPIRCADPTCRSDQADHIMPSTGAERWSLRAGIGERPRQADVVVSSVEVCSVELSTG